jgi:excisionase family DNA binding protein
MGEKMLLVSIVAARLNCDARTVYRMIKRGDLPAIKVGKRGLRVLESALANYVRSNIVDPEKLDAR